MAFIFVEGEPWADALRRLVREQIDAAISAISGGEVSAEVGVHEARKACKRVRAVLRLAQKADRDLYDRENAFFRESARSLAQARDADSAVSAWDRLMSHEAAAPLEDRVTGIREKLCEQQQLAHQQAAQGKRRSAFVRRMRAVRQRLNRWKLPENALEIVRDGIHRTYRRGRKAMARAAKDANPETFHEWRKRTKDLYYQLSLLRNVCPWAHKKRRNRVDELGEMLGQLHDLVVLQIPLRADSQAKVAVGNLEFAEHLVNARSRQLQRAALVAGEKYVFHRPPRKFAKKLKSLQ